MEIDLFEKKNANYFLVSAHMVQFQYQLRHYSPTARTTYFCCDMSQNDTIGKIELNPSFVLSSNNTNCKNDIQLLCQLFDELSVHTDYH